MKKLSSGVVGGELAETKTLSADEERRFADASWPTSIFPSTSRARIQSRLSTTRRKKVDKLIDHRMIKISSEGESIKYSWQSFFHFHEKFEAEGERVVASELPEA